MQGEQTVPEVTAGIEALQKHPGVDVVVIIRGGGAKTDLFSFDDVFLCKTVAQCVKPVVTGIGHEIDVSVADLVAHTRCVTPTDVARFLVSRMDEAWAFLDHAHREISRRSREVFQRAGERLRLTASGLGHVTKRWMISSLSVLKECVFYLHTALTKDLAGREQALLMASHGLTASFDAAVQRELQALGVLPCSIIRDMRVCFTSREADLCRKQQRLGDSAQLILVRQHDRLEHLHSLVRTMDPSTVLKRGYSITADSSGRIVLDSASVQKDERITTVLARGRIVSTVAYKEP